MLGIHHQRNERRGGVVEEMCGGSKDADGRTQHGQDLAGNGGNGGGGKKDAEKVLVG